jgi:hypothetical protein
MANQACSAYGCKYFPDMLQFSLMGTMLVTVFVRGYKQQPFRGNARLAIGGSLRDRATFPDYSSCSLQQDTSFFDGR